MPASHGSVAAYDVVLAMLKRIKAEEGKAWDIVLFQGGTGQGTAGEPLQSFEFAPGEALEPFARDIVDAAAQEADTFEQGHGGPTRVTFVAMVKGHTPPLRRTFSIHLGEEDDEDEFGEAMNPSHKSQVSEQMLHNRLLLKATLGPHLDMIAMYQRELRAKEEIIARYEKRHFEQVRLLEEMYDHRAERELSVKAQEASDRRKDEMMEQFIPALTVGVNHLLGRRLIGAGTGPTSSLELMVAKLLESISPEQLGSLQGMLRSEQQLVLMEIFKTVSDAEEARKKQQAEKEAAEAAVHASETNGVAHEEKPS